MSEESSDKVNTNAPKKRSVLQRVLLSVLLFIASVGVFISSQFVATVAVYVLGRSVVQDEDTVSQLFDNNLVVLLMYLLSSIIVVLVLLATTSLSGRSFLKQIGVQRKPRWSDIAWSMLAYASYFVTFALVAVIALPLLQDVINVDQQQNLGVSLDSSALNMAVLFVMFVIIPPIIEEVLFRGFMYRVSTKLMPKWLGLILVSIVFGVMHLELFSAESPNWIAMIDTTILSVFLVILVEKTNSLWPAIYLHATKNLVAYALLLSGLAS